MTRSDPSPSVQWLIAELAQRGMPVSPYKIERLQHAGLAPKPKRSSKGVEPADLWKQGAVDHYVALIPLHRQRHDSTELAAITMLGAGYPVEVELMRRSYRKAFSLPLDSSTLSDVLVDMYENKGNPMFSTMLRRLRMSAFHDETITSGAQSFQTVKGLIDFFLGDLRIEQLVTLLGTLLPEKISISSESIAWLYEVFLIFSKELSLSALLETTNTTSVEELLAVQPVAHSEMSPLFTLFGFTNYRPESQPEIMDLVTGLVLPMRLRMRRWEEEDFFAKLPPHPESWNEDAQIFDQLNDRTT